MKKIKEILKNNLGLIILTLIGSIVCILTFKIEIDIKQTWNKFGIYRYICMLIIALLCILTSVVAWRLFKKHTKLENIFLIFIIPIGLLYIFIIPVGRVPDESAHFFRSYEIASGTLISPKNDNKQGGDYLPKNINKIFDNSTKYQDEIKKINIKASKSKEFILFPNTSLYSFITYIPQTIGISIGILFNLPILWIAIFGRLTNFLIWTTLMYFSIKIMPFKKFSLLLIMLLPMMLQEAASLSADALTNGSIFFFLSYIMYLTDNQKKTISKKEIIILSITTIIMSVNKIVYLPICLFVFLIPNKKFKSNKKKYTWIALLAIAVIIINLFFLSKSLSYVVRTETNISATDQIKYILHNPTELVSTVYKTIYYNFNMYVTSFIGENLCWFDVSVTTLFTRMISAILILTMALDTFNFKIKDKVISFIVAFSVISLIFASEYLTWTTVGASIIDGIQGRYFIPLTIPFLMLFNLKNLKYDLNKLYKYLFLIMIFINISVLATLLNAHF